MEARPRKEGKKAKGEGCEQEYFSRHRDLNMNLSPEFEEGESQGAQEGRGEG